MSVPSTPHPPSARASQPPTNFGTPSVPSQNPLSATAPTAPSLPQLPAPSDFDILPSLHALLTRLQAPPSLSQLPKEAGGDSAADSTGAASLRLEPHQLSGEANAIKRKIGRAREKVLQLPDVDRSVEDQEDEIADLEGRIERLKARLRGLGRRVGEEENGDSRMTG